MAKIIISLIASFVLLSACAMAPRHHILGAGSWGFPGNEVTVFSDIRIGKLRIRHSSHVLPECRNGHSHFLELDGPINADAVVALDRLLGQMPRCYRHDGVEIVRGVYMNSRGGYLNDGYEIGRLFRRHGVQTILTGPQQCASACAIAFLGGVHRTLLDNSTLMFHSPYLIYGRNIQCLSDGDSSSLRTYYAEMLNSSDAEILFNRTMHYCSAQEGWTINAGAAKLFGITTE